MHVGTLYSMSVMCAFFVSHSSGMNNELLSVCIVVPKEQNIFILVAD